MEQKIAFPQKIVDDYICKIASKIKLDGVFLFGSFAYGKPTKHSDIDLAVISPDFKKIQDRLFWLTWQRRGTADTLAMDVFGYTPQEFRDIDKESAIMTYAKKHGKWIYKAK